MKRGRDRFEEEDDDWHRSGNGNGDVDDEYRNGDVYGDELEHRHHYSDDERDGEVDEGGFVVQVEQGPQRKRRFVGRESDGDNEFGGRLESSQTREFGESTGRRMGGFGGGSSARKGNRNQFGNRANRRNKTQAFGRHSEPNTDEFDDRSSQSNHRRHDHRQHDSLQVDDYQEETAKSVIVQGKPFKVTPLSRGLRAMFGM
eukprot:TRINITY_DN2834_c0_g1_i1.p1 TRINITY_DN2834_c0_g1~~TRINITY_DN2834_c0_g1_i1.p1  ORF type:complete len:201 (-),score=38.39 TRINITY_DN2834_c0_g1_i1:41-643(-)